jgi:hypothetical protein
VGKVKLHYRHRFIKWFSGPYITQFSQPDQIIQDQYNPLDWNRYAYVRYDPINHNDPTGNDVGCSAADPECQDSNGLSPKVKLEIQVAENKILAPDGWDLIPVVNDIRAVIQGAQTANFASQQPNFKKEQTQLQGWQNECYGQCHNVTLPLMKFLHRMLYLKRFWGSEPFYGLSFQFSNG